MAARPAYLIENGKVIRKDYDFTWISGLSASQKQKCALSLHEAMKHSFIAEDTQVHDTLKNVYQLMFTKERHLVNEKIEGFFNDMQFCVLSTMHKTS